MTEFWCGCAARECWCNNGAVWASERLTVDFAGLSKVLCRFLVPPERKTRLVQAELETRFCNVLARRR